MPSGQIVSIKIAPYLKEFFIYKHGAEPIRATRETKFFMFICQFLSRKPKKGWKPPVVSEDTLLVELPYNEFIKIRDYCYINPRFYPEIKTYIYGLFYGAFISYMNKRCIHEKPAWSIKYAIINFIDEFNMSWNKTNYETLKKIYYRYRNPECEKIDEKNNEKILAYRETKKSQKRPLSVPYYL